MRTEDLQAAMLAARNSPAWPVVAVVGGDAPERFQGRRVEVLDIIGPPFNSKPMAHVVLPDEPPCTTMNVPPANLELVA